LRPYVPAGSRKKIGHITPSSNTVLEPLTGCISAEVEDRVSHHFARIRVESITLDPTHTGQFSADRMLEAAELLADAQVDAILWNGTSGGWNGAQADREICALIEDRTGIPASTSTLAQLEAMKAWGVSRFGLAVPYTADVAARIVQCYADEGVQAISMAHGGVATNREFAYMSADRVRDLMREADSADAQCLLFVCTGVAVSQLVDELEQELGKPIIDSLSVVVWKALQMLDIEPELTGWGQLLAGARQPLVTT
jgi:maleate isomerase